jgi:DNA polymerase III epsilon subunit-like protein
VPQAPNHQLGGLVKHLQLTVPAGLHSHRALDDVLMTCALWSHLQSLLRERLGGKTPDVELLHAVSRTPKAKVAGFLTACGR